MMLSIYLYIRWWVDGEHLTFAFVFANGKELIAYTQCAQRYGELKMEQF